MFSNGVAFFSHLGGKAMSNLERDLHVRTRTIFGLDLEPYMLPLTIHPDTTMARKTVDVATLAPYEVLDAIVRHGSVEKCLLGPDGTDSFESYWANLDRSARGREHPVNKNPKPRALRRWICPTIWTSDGIEVYNGDEYHAFMWSSATNYRAHWLDQRYFILVLAESSLVPGVTLTEVADYEVWNDKVMESGIKPHLDHLGNKFPPGSRREREAGEPLAQGYLGKFSLWGGDLKEEVKVHGFDRNHNCNDLCKDCVATKHLRFFNGLDFSPSAAWKITRISQKDYGAICAVQSQRALA